MMDKEKEKAADPAKENMGLFFFGELPVRNLQSIMPEEVPAEDPAEVSADEPETTEGKVLVVYYSATGNTGEPPSSNYRDPELIKDLVQSVDATIVECNTAYGGSRTETAMHMQAAEDYGFTAIADEDILDADGSLEIPVEGGTRLKSNLIGFHFENYDFYIVLSHFKGHAMAGFGTLKIVFGIRRFALYIAFVMAFSFVTGLLTNLVI